MREDACEAHPSLHLGILHFTADVVDSRQQGASPTQDGLRNMDRKTHSTALVTKGHVIMFASTEVSEAFRQVVIDTFQLPNMCKER